MIKKMMRIRVATFISIVVSSENCILDLPVQVLGLTRIHKRNTPPGSSLITETLTQRSYLNKSRLSCILTPVCRSEGVCA